MLARLGVVTAVLMLVDSRRGTRRFRAGGRWGISGLSPRFVPLSLAMGNLAHYAGF